MKADKELEAASALRLTLEILAKGESYGYAIIQRVKELSPEAIVWTDGMLYPALHWLEEDGQIRGRWEKAGENRRRRYYSLSAKGRKVLENKQEQRNPMNSVLKQLWRAQYA